MAFTCKKCGGHLYRRDGDRIVCQACEARYRIRRPADAQPPPPPPPPTPSAADVTERRHMLISVVGLGAAAVASMTEYVTGWPLVSGTIEFAFGLLAIGALACFYFLPSIVAYTRKHHNLGAIIIVNALIGWFFGLGWAIALAWAMTSPAPVRLTNGEEIN